MNRFRFYWTLVASATIFLSLSAFASAKDIAAVTADQAMQMLKDGNTHFVAGHASGKDVSDKRRQELAKGQHPFAAVLTCADSRVPPEYIFGQGLGDIFVVRVAGNVAETYSLGSIEYAAEHLHTPLIVILGHEKCGAVAAALSPEKPEGNLGKLIGEVSPGQNLPNEKDAAQATAVRNNLLKQAEIVETKSPVIKKLIEENKVKVVPALYHLDSGKVEWLDDK